MRSRQERGGLAKRISDFGERWRGEALPEAFAEADEGDFDQAIHQPGEGEDGEGGDDPEGEREDDGRDALVYPSAKEKFSLPNDGEGERMEQVEAVGNPAEEA